MDGDASPTNSPVRFFGFTPIASAAMVTARRINQRTNIKMDLRFTESPPFLYMKTKKAKGAQGAFPFWISSILVSFLQKSELDGWHDRRDARIAASVAFIDSYRHRLEIIFDD